MLTGGSSDLNIVVKLVDKASSQLKGLSSSMDKFGEKTKQQTEAARGFTKVMGTAGLVLGWLAVKEFASYEQQMSKVRAITNASNLEFADMNALAREMGATTVFTAKEAADSLQFLGMAGLSVTDAMAALPGTLDLAAAGNLSLGEAADIATNIMAQYGIEAENIGRVNDVLAASATGANTNIQEIAEAMKYLGPVANNFKIPIEEGAAAINILANNGIKAGMAGQAFATSLLRITKPTSAMQESIDALNLTLFDQNGAYVGLTDTVRQLEEGTVNMTDKQKAAHVATLFGVRSTKHWMTLIKDGSGELERYTGLLEDSGGAAKRMAEIQLDNLAGSFTLLKSAISGTMITVGGMISTVLRPALDSLTSLITNFRTNWENLSPGMQTFIKIAGTTAIVLSGLVITMGLIGFILPVLTMGVSALAGAFALLFSPIGLMVAAIVAFGVAYKENFLGFGTMVDTVVAMVLPLFQQIWEGVVNIYTKVAEYLNRIKVPFMELVEFLTPMIQDFMWVLEGLFRGTFAGIVLIIQGAWSVIQGIFNIAFGIIGGALEVFLNLLTGNWSGAWEGIKVMTMTILEGISQITAGFIAILTGAFTIFFSSVQAIFNAGLMFIKNLFITVWTGIVGYVGGVISAIENIFLGGTNNISNAWSGAMQGMKWVVSTVWGSIKATIANGINWVIDKINWLIKKANAVASKIPGAPKISTIPPLTLQNGGIAKLQSGGFAGGAGGFVPGSRNPSNHDQIAAMLDPGELVLNRAQQANLAGQLMGTSTNTKIIKVEVAGNHFYGDDESFSDKIGETIIDKIKQNIPLQAF